MKKFYLSNDQRFLIRTLLRKYEAQLIENVNGAYGVYQTHKEQQIEEDMAKVTWILKYFSSATSIVHIPQIFVDFIRAVLSSFPGHELKQNEEEVDFLIKIMV